MSKETTLDKPATERQRRILEVIDAFTAEHGYPPSVREIGERVGLSSSSTIHAHLKALERRGLISRDPTKPRALRSASAPVAQNALVVPILGRVAAGVPITAQEDIEGEFLLPSGYVPRASDAFMLRVQGDSMVEAAILDGDGDFRHSAMSPSMAPRARAPRSTASPRASTRARFSSAQRARDFELQRHRPRAYAVGPQTPPDRLAMRDQHALQFERIERKVVLEGALLPV